jgi:hypothetical protein
MGRFTVLPDPEVPAFGAGLGLVRGSLSGLLAGVRGRF